MTTHAATALAIDLGTTAAKAGVVRSDGTLAGTGQEPITTTFGVDGSATQDPQAVWQAVVRACRAALAAAGVDSVDVVCAASQWASIVPVDGNGEPLGPMMTWLDGRGDALCSPLLDGPGGGDNLMAWAGVHGLPPAASLGRVLWFQNERPDIHARTAAYLEPMDYLGARLTGRIAATANTTIPYTLTDTRNIASVGWSDDLVARSGVDPSRLPPIVAPMSMLGGLSARAAAELGLRTGTPVAAGASDSVAAALGTGAVAAGRGTVVMGTTGVFAAHHGSTRADSEFVLTTMPSALPNEYIVVAEAGLAGKVLETAVEQWFADGTPSFERFLDAAAASTPGSGGTMFLPWVNGTIAPSFSPDVRGGFTGLSLHTTRGDIARSVIEGINLQMRWLVDEVERMTTRTYASVRFAGGGAQSTLWAQVLADVLGRTVERVSDPRHAPTRGAAFLGLLSIGALDLARIDSLVMVTDTFVPAPGTGGLYAPYLDAFRSLHETLGTIGRLPRSNNP